MCKASQSRYRRSKVVDRNGERVRGRTVDVGARDGYNNVIAGIGNVVARDLGGGSFNKGTDQ